MNTAQSYCPRESQEPMRSLAASAATCLDENRKDSPLKTGSDGPRVRVLIVEDDDSLVDCLSRYLERKGHRVHKASGVEEALGILRAERIDVTLLDNGLPDRMGLSALGDIPNYSDAAVILMTGYPSQVVEEYARSLGAKEYLVKPIPLKTLERRIREITFGK